MAVNGTSFPTRRAAAERNREKILASARDAFADPDAEVSMAEVARRAGVGMATLYRNFPGRRELLEALYADEVDAICRAARIDDGRAPGEALGAWLRLHFDFIPNKRLIVAELLEHASGDGDSDSDGSGAGAAAGAEAEAVPGHRHRALAAGEPLLAAAQEAGEIRRDITLVQIFDMIVAIARIHGDGAYLEPIIRTMLDGLRAPAGAPDV